MSFWKDITTGQDNISHDVGRVMAIIAFLVGMGLQIYAVAYKGQPFDLSTYGAGVGIMFTGIGAMLFLKKDTEPKP